MQIFSPKTLRELLEIKDIYGRDALIIAGGTDIMVAIKSSRITPKYLISLKKVKEFSEVEPIYINERDLICNCYMTLTEIEKSSIANQYLPELVKAVSTIGSRQIRNVATLIGNICNASPAADSVPALLINDAKIVASNIHGDRMISIHDFVTAPKKTILEHNEIVTSIRIEIDKRPVLYSDYFKLSRTNGVDISGLGIALKMYNEYDLRIALGSVGPKAFRCNEVETQISENGLMKISIDHIIDNVLNKCAPISDVRATKEYRLKMVEENMRRLISHCFEMIKENNYETNDNYPV